MKVIFAKNIGFCPGVKRAIAIAEKSLREDPKSIQFLGSLIHNEKILEKFIGKGVKFRRNLREVKPGTLIIQAHGFSPFSIKKVLIRDATCLLVKKVQLIANSLYKKGCQVIIIGDKKHSETKGIKGYTKNTALIIENKNQAKKLLKFGKIGVVAQTTQCLDNVNEILKILKNKKVKYFNTLCPEVQARQRELNLLLKKVGGILVIGSRDSANTKRLFQIAKNSKKLVWWVNSLKELKRRKIKNLQTLGVISGTSTPNQEIEKIKKYLKKAKRSSSSSSPSLP